MPMDRVRDGALLTGVVAGLLAASGCSGGGGQGGGGQGGTPIAQSGSGGAGSGGVTTGAGGAVGTTSSGGTTTASTYPNVGVCGQRGQATADATSFDGWEERYIIGEQGFGTDVCAVRFTLERVGDAPGGCTVCSWTHLLAYGSPTVITDTDGVCAQSDLALDADAIAKVAGTRVALGFAKQLGGAHGSARMIYNEATATWDVAGNATWNETSNAFNFDYRDGLCNYGP
jgi:hypothetical protein